MNDAAGPSAALTDPASAAPSAIGRWRAWHRSSLFRRAAVKLVIFMAVFGLVMYPKVWMAPTWLYRLTHLNSVINADASGLESIAEEVRAQLPPDAGAREAQQAVESVVYKRVPYSHDWVTWGVFDHLPTVDEVLSRGTDDCDGRAVVAASTLRHMGYDAWLVTDLLHTWVQTPEGDALAMERPGRVTLSGRPGADGKTETTVAINPGLIANLGRGLGYGVSVFPLARIAIIVGTFLALVAHPRVGAIRYLAGALLVIAGLAAIRVSGEPFARSLSPATGAGVGLGLALIVLGWLLIAIRDRRALP
ncbi:MAG: hypothetical protein KDA32_03905 [Phycisphaerales bacterium]|nr:hypothetical protein [Phycisphaerales bacterium]